MSRAVALDMRLWQSTLLETVYILKDLTLQILNSTQHKETVNGKGPASRIVFPEETIATLDRLAQDLDYS
jgi:hypothetical protein